MLDLIYDAEDVDAAMQTWIRGAMPWWIYEDVGKIPGMQVDNSKGDGKPPQAVHLYRDLWMACMWNMYRTGRISLQQTLLECADFLDITEWPRGELDPQPHSCTYARSMAIIDEMAHDVCASTPFILGEVDSEGRIMPQSARKAVGGYLLMYPLFIVKNCPYVSPTRVAHVQRALQIVGHVLGLKQAFLIYAHEPMLPRVGESFKGESML
jgi:hypothetical protein